MKRLSVIDAAFLEIETHESPMHVANLMVMTIPETREQESFLRELLDSFCDLAKSSAPFNRKLASPHLLSGWPAWIEDDGLDLTFHIRRSAVPLPHGIPDWSKNRFFSGKYLFAWTFILCYPSYMLLTQIFCGIDRYRFLSKVVDIEGQTVN
ncbi:MAG: hypothetical protein HQM11_03575 [SAR324 cluster bacterium]|nr:hypothetical protein [SAR324 cluster bacterium]